jgi:N-glycosylase/DNA lyase
VQAIYAGMRIQAKDFSLQQTLESGQLFRYEVVSEGFLVCHRDKAFVISQDGDSLRVHAATSTVTKKWLEQFLSLDDCAPQAVDNYTEEALLHCSGLRICKQDPWECTIGFICSQNNNIKRIRQLMTGIAQAFGTRVTVGKYETYLFPEPGKIRAGKKLAAIKTGYREKYLLAANKLSDEWLASLRALSYDEAKLQLLTLHGVGPKVADCILLFAYQHKNAFPVDTWVSQIMKEQYNTVTTTAMHKQAQELFGANAGHMQQYLFHYKRHVQRKS